MKRPKIISVHFGYAEVPDNIEYDDRQIKYFSIPEHEVERLKRQGKFEKRRKKKQRLDKGK